MANKGRSIQEAPEKAGCEGWLHSEQQLLTIWNGISAGRVTQYTVCVVEFSTLIHLDHGIFEIRAELSGLSP